MRLDLNDEQTATLLKELDRIIDGEGFPLSPRIRTLNEIRVMIRPEPLREPLPAQKHHEPPKRGRYSRRR
jgi:hypothetical protein